MSNIVINCDYYFRRRLEKAKETVEELMTDAPSTGIDFQDSEDVEEAFEELETYMERIQEAQRELKYFFEDLIAALAKE